MRSKKLFHVGVLFLVAAALIAATPAVASAKRTIVTGATLLKPADTSDEPKASGRATFTGTWVWVSYVYPDVGVWYMFGGLTATYQTSAGSFTASATGTGTATATVISIDPPQTVYVAREEPQPDGTIDLIIVLEGTLKVH
jgi:hypothetical protein